MYCRAWAPGSLTSRAAAGTGRRTWLAIMMTFSPSSRVAGLTPPGGPMRTALHPLGRRHLVPARVLGLLHELVHDGGAAHVAEEVEEDRDGLEPMAVAVDHRVIELRAHRRRLGI